MDEKYDVCMPRFWCFSYLFGDIIPFPLFEFLRLLRCCLILGKLKKTSCP